MFIPATSRRLPFAARQRPLDAGALGQQRRGRGGGAGAEQLFAGEAALSRLDRPRSFVPPEDVDGVAAERGRVEIAAVGAERDRADAAQRPARACSPGPSAARGSRRGPASARTAPDSLSRSRTAMAPVAKAAA